MGKCILLVRVSTERQSFDEQEQQLFQLAIEDGYAENDIIAVSEKESGRKLKEEERRGLNRMKELIESDSSIDGVYAWEISRIARKKVILFSILDYLVGKKIQLIIKEPYLKLLNANGTINESSEMTFTLFAQMAESEMRNKDARFKRAKDEMKRNHQYRGGFLPLGYKVNEVGKIVVDEENAVLVRLIFDLYANKNISPYKIPKELESRGINMSYSHICKIVGNINYCNGEMYPIIISKELWEKKCAVAKANNKVIDKSKKVYFGAKLIKCSCGNSYCVNSSGVSYCCHGKYIGKQCTNTKGVGINTMDSVLWWAAKQEYASFLSQKSVETKERLIQELEIWKQKLNALDLLYDKITEKLSRQSELYGDLAISKEIYQKRRKKIFEEKTDLDNNAINYQNEINRIEDILKTEYSTDNDNLIDGFIVPMIMKREELLIELDKLPDERKYEIVHQYIESVHIEYINTNKKIITIYVKNYIGLTRELVISYIPNCKDRNKNLTFQDGKQLEGYQYIERIKRKPPKDIDKDRAFHKEYARKYRAKMKAMKEQEQ